MRALGFLLLFALAAPPVQGKVGLFGMVQFNPLIPRLFPQNPPVVKGARMGGNPGF